MANFWLDTMDKENIEESYGFTNYHSIILRPDRWGDTRHMEPYCVPLPEADFRRGIQMWESSKDCEKLVSVMKSITLPKVTRIIAFGLSHPIVDQNSATIIQHAAVLTIKQILEDRDCSQGKVECFAQDPMYLDSDVDLLGLFGIEIVKSPNGLLMLDDQTVVFSHYPAFDIEGVVADLAKPAMLFTATP